MKKMLKLAMAVALVAMMLVSNVSALVVLDNCDNFQVDDVPAWAGTYLEAVEDSEAPEGTGYVQGTPVDGMVLFLKGWDPIDLGEVMETVYFHVDVYVPDASSLTGGQLELTSSGNPDNEENSWEVTALGLEDGWNHLALKVSEGTQVAGGLDFTNFNCFRLYVFTGNAENNIAIDNLGFGTEDAIDTPIDNCDAIKEDTGFEGNSWAGSDGGYYYGEDGNVYTVIDDVETLVENAEGIIKEGNGSIYDIDKTTLINMFINTTGSFDLSEYEEDGYLMFDLYLSDGYGTSLGGQIELTSSGSCDVEEITWNMAQLSYIDTGWNKIALSFADADAWMNNVDLTQIDTFRIYDFVVAGDYVEMIVDNVCVGTYDEAVELGFLTPVEETEEVTEEATEEVTEEATEEVTEEVTEEATEEVTEEATEGTAAPAPAEEGSNMGLIIGIVAVAVVVVAVIIIVVLKNKKK